MAFTPFTNETEISAYELNLRLNELNDQIEAKAASTFYPIGSIIPFSGSSIPLNWIKCDGSAISRTTYSGLFAITSTTYGSGDGSTTFNVPNMQLRTAIGSGTGSGLTNRVLGSSSGNYSFQLLTTHVVGHRHNIPYQSQNVDSTGSGGTMAATTKTGSAGGDGYHNNMAPSLTVNYIMRAI